MKTKIIPFNIELAKKIQVGEVEGRIMYNGKIGGEEIIVLSYNYEKYRRDYPIRFVYVNHDEIDYLHDTSFLFIELPEEVPIDNNGNHGFCRFIPNPNHREGVIGDYSLASINENKSINVLKSSTLPKHEFKPFDKVLVRDTDKDTWRPRLYSRKGRVGYCMQDNYEYMQILPYEGNEHLVGTTDKPKED